MAQAIPMAQAVPMAQTTTMADPGAQAVPMAMAAPMPAQRQNTYTMQSAFAQLNRRPLWQKVGRGAFFVAMVVAIFFFVRSTVGCEWSDTT